MVPIAIDEPLAALNWIPEILPLSTKAVSWVKPPKVSNSWLVCSKLNCVHQATYCWYLINSWRTLPYFCWTFKTSIDGVLFEICAIMAWWSSFSALVYKLDCRCLFWQDHAISDSPDSLNLSFGNEREQLRGPNDFKVLRSVVACSLCWPWNMT